MQKEPKRGGDSDIDGTTNRVASVTLESDSLSEAPKSFRNKRRKRISRREKSAIALDVDKQSIDTGLDHGEYISEICLSILFKRFAIDFIILMYT